MWRLSDFGAVGVVVFAAATNLPMASSAMTLKVVGNQLILSGRVVGDEPGEVTEALAKSPDIDTVILRNSPGGDAPAGYQVVIANSHVKAAKSASARDQFNSRVASYNLGLALLRQRCPEIAGAIEHLRDIDPARLGTTGMSMGSTMAWWLAALDERIKVCVDICCLTDFQALLETDGLKGHGIYYFVPSLLKCFTTSQINALIAPRAHLGLAGNKDPLTPSAGLDRIDRELKSVYQECGKPDHWKLLRYDVGHEETPEMREEIVRFLGEFL